MVPSTAFDPFEPFAYGFFQRGLAVALVAGALCGLVGVYVVLRSMSYAGHGLSHAVFGGAAMSAALGGSYFLGAGVWGVITALLIARVAGRGMIGSDAAIASSPRLRLRSGWRSRHGRARSDARSTRCCSATCWACARRMSS
jgi:hypothetical protein